VSVFKIAELEKRKGNKKKEKERKRWRIHPKPRSLRTITPQRIPIAKLSEAKKEAYLGVLGKRKKVGASLEPIFNQKGVFRQRHSTRGPAKKDREKEV